MTQDQRLTQAVRHVADRVTVPDVDLDAVRARAGASRRRMVSAGVAAVVTIIVAGAAIVTDRDVSAPVTPSSTVPPSSTASPSTSPLPSIETGPKSWTTYSTRYDFTIGHPPDWTEIPATRDWMREHDARDSLSSAHEAFRSPEGDVRVSAWTAPLDPGTRIESIADIETWVEDYCEESGNSPCTGIADRAVELCLEKWDCHPGLLVPFKADVQAFFSGGIYDSEAMTVVSVWRPESAPSTARYGGSQRLLEGFLSTMQVWPSTTPRRERR